MTKNYSKRKANLPTSPRANNLLGKTFGNLRVLRFIDTNKWGNTRWLCQCKCGNTKIVAAGNLKQGTKSCGCLTLRKFIERSTIHGESHRTVEYTAYKQSRGRCNNPNNPSYPRYGGRGIKFLFANFQEFLTEVGRKPHPEHSLNRINNDGHYEKGNVEWANRIQQNNNKCNCIYLTIDGITQSVGLWAKQSGISPKCVYQRKSRNKWCDECCINPHIRRCSHKISD